MLIITNCFFIYETWAYNKQSLAYYILGFLNIQELIEYNGRNT